jgi:hypothetical protein
VFLKLYTLLLLVPNRIPFTDMNQVQRIFWKFYASSISLIELQNMSNDIFEDYISTNHNACIREVLRQYFPRFSARRNNFVDDYEEPSVRVEVELCANKSKTVVECGICLSDDIPCSKMVKLGCGHEFCGDCAENMVNAKPCCAFCRADVKKVSVGSKSVLSKFKKNKKFVVY